MSQCGDGHDWWTPDGRPNDIKLVPSRATWLKPSVPYLRPVSVRHTWACRRCGQRRRGAMGASPVDIVFRGDPPEAQRIFDQHRALLA